MLIVSRMVSNLIINWVTILGLIICQSDVHAKWSNNDANTWYGNTGWIIGCNFVPSTAENTLQMWQNATFDRPTITKELSWVRKTGMNTVRVFLHHLLWHENSADFLQKIRIFLSIADNFQIKTILVLLDDCWNPVSHPGSQLPPIPHVHNSRWVQTPDLSGLNNATFQDTLLKDYVQGVINSFSNDSRVLFWDLYNEPGNRNLGSYDDPISKPLLSLTLLKKVFKWARAINPTQPLTSPIWTGATYSLANVQEFQLNNSDIITFHNYEPLSGFNETFQSLKLLNRPIICTEFMARPMGSTFEAILPFAKPNNIGAMNWGWVNGKTQTIYPWDSWHKNYTRPPVLWFHDVYHKNGTAYREEEVFLISHLSQKQITTTEVSNSAWPKQRSMFIVIYSCLTMWLVCCLYELETSH